MNPKTRTEIAPHANTPLSPRGRIANPFAKVEIFDWTNEEETLFISFCVTDILNQIRNKTLKHQSITTEIDKNFAPRWLMHRDLNFSYIHSLSNSRLSEPVLGVTMPDSTVLLIDGAHRYMARLMKGETLIDMNLVTFDDIWSYVKIGGNRQWKK